MRKILSVGATSLDLCALGLSTAGTILEGVAAAGLEISTPIPGVDGALGLAGAIGVYNELLNPIENGLSLASASMVATADFISGQTHFESIDLGLQGGQSTELVFGADTTFSLASIAVGNTSLTPEAATDTLANLATVYYGVARLAEDEPIWGLYEFRIGHKQDGDLFHGWYTRFGRKNLESEDN